MFVNAIWYQIIYMIYLIWWFTLKLIINEKYKFELIQANTFFKKLIGLSFKNNINYALKFRCNGIHTFFMRENIDIIMTDKYNNILKYYKNIKKNRIILPKKNVYYTYEIPTNICKYNIPKKIEIENWFLF